MKNNLLITLDFPPNFGGVATYYYNICLSLPSDKIIVLAPTDPLAQNFDNRQDFKVVRKGLIGKNRLSIYFSIISIIKIINRHKIDMIHIGNILPLGILAWLINKWNKTPYLIYTHGLDVVYPQKFWRKKLLMKLIIKSASALIANSNFTKNELIKLGAAENKITVVYPCSNLKPIALSETEINAFKNQHGLNNKKILLSAGRLVERKGHDQVIMALPEIIKMVPSLIYLIAGAGPRLDQLGQLATECGVASAVRFLGPLADNELALCYNVADVFIMPSRQLADGDVEGFGIVYLEANLYHKPVIGGSSGGVPEAVLDGETGLLVDPLNTSEIAQKTIKLLTDQTYAQQLGEQGFIRASKEFIWTKQAQKLIAILNS